MVTICLTVTGISIRILYTTAIKEEQARLTETVQSQAQLIEAITRYNSAHNKERHPDLADSVAATLEQIRDAHAHYAGFGETGEFALSRKEGNEIVFLLSHRHHDLHNLKPVPFDSELAEPMRRALSGQSGSLIGLDYRGETVLAAYMPLRTLNLGIVAKIDLSEIRAPFIRAGLISFFAALIAVLLGTLLFFKITNPMIRRLAESEDRFRRLYEQAPLGYQSLDKEGSIIEVNQAWLDLMGYSRDQVIGRWFGDFLAPHELASFKRRFPGFIETGEAHVDFQMVRHDGSIIITHIDGGIGLDERGQFKQTHCILHDVTARKQTEEELIKSEERFRALIENALDGIMLLSAEGHIIYQSPSNQQILGYPPEDMQGRHISEFIHPEDLSDTINTFSQVVQNPGSVELAGLRVRHQDGSYRVVEGTGRNLLDNLYIEGVVINYKDVTERHQAEEARVRLETAISHAAESILITDKDANIQYINPAFEKITGYSWNEVIGRNPRFLKSGKHDAGLYKELWSTITSGQVWRGHLTNKKKDGTLFEEVASISPILDGNGNIINYVAVKRDVTEEVALEFRMRQSQKMEAIGTLAGGIAHDFNNILSAVIGFTELSLDSVEKDSLVADNLQQVLTAGNRAKDLVRQILAFSRETEQERQPLDIVPVIKEVLKLLRASLPATIEIRQNIDNELYAIEADPTELHQILMNLCTNADHAMREQGGILEVSLSNVDLGVDFTDQYPDIKPGPYLKLIVSDTGVGMSPEVMDRIFDPFFTTKKTGEGTGLGMAVVHGLVKNYGGLIKVYSELGQGTSFQVFLPAIKRGAPLREEYGETVPAGTESILLIDDEPILVEICKQALERLGYRVTTRTSSLEALDLFRVRSDDFDLVISDVTLPKMTGDVLAEELMRVRPDIPVVLCTGYSTRITEERVRDLGIRAILMKPIIRTDLANTIRNVLDKAKDSDAQGSS